MVLIGTVLAFGVCCGSSAQPPRPTPIPDEIPADWYDPEPGPSAAPRDVCAAACTRLRNHACPEGQPSPKGATCEERCHTYEKSNLVSFHPACVARVKDSLSDDKVCRAAKACEKQK